MPNNIKVRKRDRRRASSTDINLLVHPESKDEFFEWDKKKIVSALREEAGLTKKIAVEIADAVEVRVLKSNLKTISTSLIRELVDNELFDRGLQQKLESQQIIGLPKFDIDELIFRKSQENSNIMSNNPEAISHSISETISKQYALQKIFSQEVADAHRNGVIHLHDLGYAVRVYCSGHSVEYLKKYGLELDNLECTSAPAKHARTLTTHINTFLSSMQAYYAGALGMSYVNIMYAPYVEGMSEKEMIQEAQHLIFQASQNAFTRGGQSIFIDFNVHAGVPGYLKNIQAIGPGGKYTGRTYSSYADAAMKFTKAMLKVWGDGDRYGVPFPFPKLDFHVNQETFDDPNQSSVLDLACDITSKNGIVYFMFDRDEVTMAACCRLRTTIDDQCMIDRPETLRFCGFQNVTVNLPQCAYRAGKGNIEKLYEEIEKSIELCVKAHTEKRKFISQLMTAPGQPLWQIGRKAHDGRPYVNLDDATYIVGVIGLNECVHYMFGEELHENEEILWRGIRIISCMYFAVKEWGEKLGMKFTIEESPAESASRRLAKMDIRNYPKDAIIRGSIENDDVYYTNSVHFRPDAPVDLVRRITAQSKFHKLIESGAIVHAFVGENMPSSKSIRRLVEKTYKNTNCAQLTISPEFTICDSCHKTSLGLKDICPHCGAKNININYVEDPSGLKLLPWGVDEMMKKNGK